MPTLTPYLNYVICLQCWRELRGDAGHQSHAVPRGAGGVETARHLPLFLRDGCRVFSLRRADLRHEVRQLDLRRIPGKKKAGQWKDSRYKKAGTIEDFRYKQAAGVKDSICKKAGPVPVFQIQKGKWIPGKKKSGPVTRLQLHKARP